MSFYRPIEERIKDYRPVETPPPLDELIREMRRCQDCGIPFCHSGCPLGNVIPEINAAALAGHWDLALAKLLSSSPFPEFTARICPALCEGSCVQALHEAPVSDRLVEYEVIERGFAAGLVKPRPPRRRLGWSAGVVGSGPAGLAAAFRLNRAGVSVTVYEKDARPGGFLRYGIPDFKLPKEALDRRINIMVEEGVQFECGVEAGSDISERLLRLRHRALILAVGARQKRDLNIPGRALKGVHFAVDYLAAQNRVVGGELKEPPPELNARGKRTLVLGGGDTGSDCVGTARRQGALSVGQFEILPRPPEERAAGNPWPQWPRILRVSSSHEEGCERRWNIDTLEFRPAARRPDSLGSILGREALWREEGGRLAGFEPVPGSEFEIEADLVLLALGFTGPEEGPFSRLWGDKPRQAGRLEEGVYMTGDAASGPSLAVRAIADGLRVAENVLADLGV